jgi:cytochrome P450
VLDAMRPRVEALVATKLREIDGPLEVMNGLAAPLVTTTILEQLGVPEGDHEAFRGLTVGIIMAHSGDPARLTAARAAYESLLAMVDRWEAEGEVDESSVLGAILAAPDHETVTRDEMLMLLINIALSGNGATINGIGNAVLALAQHAEGANQLLVGGVPLSSAVDELLRFDSPAHVVTRIARDRTTIGARTIRAGDTVHVVIGAANRDPDRFAAPDTLDLAREDNRHLAFGYASHFCLGAPLARIQIESVIAALLDRFGIFRIVEMARGDSFLMRGPARLTITSA